jgi:hypothetical protein
LVTEAFILARRRYFGDDRLLKNDAFNPSSTAFRIQMKLFQLFADSARGREEKPLLVLFPDRESVQRARRGLGTTLGPLVDAVRNQGLEYVDLTEAFAAEPRSAVEAHWFAPGGHYSPEGNRVVADWLGKRLTALAAQ